MCSGRLAQLMYFEVFAFVRDSLFVDYAFRTDDNFVCFIEGWTRDSLEIWQEDNSTEFIRCTTFEWAWAVIMRVSVL